MSPEQARGERIDARTDIFSLGVVLYEMVAGRAPFRGATQNDVIAAILKDEPPSFAESAPNAPRELERIVSKSLRKNREERYQTVPDLLSDLRQFKDKLSQPQTVETQTGETRSRGWLRGLAVLCVFAFVAACVATWFYVSRRPLLNNTDTILLADFENKTGEAIFDERVSRQQTKLRRGQGARLGSLA